MPQTVVLGAGVVGLTTALQAQDEGHDVTIIADAFPTDSNLPHSLYTSQWAAAIHLSFAEADDKWLQAIEKETFEVFLKMSDPQSTDAAEGCFLRVDAKCYFEEAPPGHWQAAGADFLIGVRELNKDQLIAGSTAGLAFTTLTIEPATYLPHLLARFLGRGGSIVRARVQHIDQVVAGAFTTGLGPPDAIFVCAGIGARFLGGVEDASVYPVRGQTVLLKAPWFKDAVMLMQKNGDFTHIAPRRSGIVLLGGVREADDWYPHARPEVAEGFLERGVTIWPELAPPAAREGGRLPTKEDIRPLIVGHGCGLRPYRKGGIRLEKEWRQVPRSEKRVAIIHNYGHAGSGYQTSWGTATRALALAAEALAETTPAQL